MGRASRKEIQSREDSAHHEAGHAVATCRVDLVGGAVTIKPKDGKLGLTLHEGDSITGATDDLQAIIAYAGYAAEKRHNSRADKTGSISDEESAEFYAHGKEEELRKKAEKIVAESWEQIECVAMALLEDEILMWEEWDVIINAVDEGREWRKDLAQIRLLMHHPIPEKEKDR